MKPENTPNGSPNHANNLHGGPTVATQQNAIADAERSASAAAALASASQAAEAAEAASTVAAAEAAKRRATLRAANGMTSPADALATTPNSTPNSATTVQQTMTPVAPNHSAHKVSKGFIVALVILGLTALASLGCVLWYFLIYSQPTTVAKDALARILAADRVSLVADIATTTAAGSNTAKFGLSYGETEGLYIKSEGNATATLESGENVTLSANANVLSPEFSAYYFNVGGISDIFTTLLNAQLDASGMAEAGYTNDDLETMSPELGLINDLISEIDGTWWGVTDATNESAAQVIDFSQCLISSLGSEASTNAYISIYDRFPFLSAEKYNDAAIDNKDGYKISINELLFTDFLNAVYSEIVYANVNTCLATSGVTNEGIDEPDGDFVTLDNVKSLDLNAALEHFVFIIDGFSHQLTKIYYCNTFDEGTDNEVQIAIVTEIEYPASLTFTAPEDARDASELVNTFSTTFGGLLEIGNNSVVNQSNQGYYDPEQPWLDAE